MLRLSRRTGEGFAINEEIFVWIRRTSNGRCEVAIDAPQHQIVRRCELPLETERLVQRTATAIGVHDD